MLVYENGELVTQSGAPPASSTSKFSASSKPPPSWPLFLRELSGGSEVRVKNNHEFEVKVGLRAGNMGKDFSVPPKGTRKVFVPATPYEIYFRLTPEPDALYRSDDFVLRDGRRVEIELAAPKGTYRIRKVD